jgi:phosphoglycolate phosphatase
MKYRAVLFDLDGTLLDTLRDLADSMNRVLAGMGYPIHDTKKYQYFVGDGMEMLAHSALPPGTSNETTAQCVSFMKEEYGKHWADKTHPYKGIPELLESLVGRDVKMTILSNKPDDLTRVVVNKLLPQWRFKAVVGARAGIPKKPDPTMALEIANNLNILPSEFLYLGDTDTDMKTANAAGMYSVGALWGFRTADELTKAGAKTLIKNPMELMKLFN